MTTDKLDKLDAATIRELLARIEQEPPVYDGDKLVEVCRYALELSDKVEQLKSLSTDQTAIEMSLRAQLQSQAAELERLRRTITRLEERRVGIHRVP
jgi:hypothetical protein